MIASNKLPLKTFRSNPFHFSEETIHRTVKRSVAMAAPTGNGMLLVTQYIPATNAYPLQQGAAVAGQTPPGFMQRFIKGEPKALGTVQIMIGLIDILLGGILCSITYAPIAAFTGVVFWGAVFFFISGGLSISAEKNGTLCLVRGSLGMNIISSIVAGIGVIIYVSDLSIPPFVNASGCDYFDGYLYSSIYYDCTANQDAAMSLRTGILAVLLILSILEFCISISSSAFGCKSVCEDCCSKQAQQPALVVQNAYPQDPRFHSTQSLGIPVAQGIPGMISMGQGIPASYGIPFTQGIPTAQGVSGAPIPTTEMPPSYYKTVPGDAT